MRERAAHLAHRYGHYGYNIVAVVFIAMGILAFFDNKQHQHSWGSAVSVTLVICVSTAFYAIEAHGNRLCETCAEHMPLSGSAAAEKHRYELRLAHLVSDHGQKPRLVLLTSCLVLGACDLLFPSVALNVLQLLWFASLSAVFVSLSTHYMLQPWCPQCHWGNGGAEEPSPTPVNPSYVG